MDAKRQNDGSEVPRFQSEELASLERLAQKLEEHQQRIEVLIRGIEALQQASERQGEKLDTLAVRLYSKLVNPGIEHKRG